MKLEMRTVQKIAAAAMTLAVMFGCASPLKPLAASAAQNTVSVSADIDEENSYISAQDQMYQKDFLKLINKARAKAGLNSVELGDAAHNAAAAERAEELATTYSYVRPNGQRDFTVFAENGIGDVSVGENYLAGVSTPDSAMDQWMNLDFARERILNADATTVSVGHYEGGAYGNYWVLIFSYPENSHTDDFRQESAGSGQCRACKVRPDPAGDGRCQPDRCRTEACRRDRYRQLPYPSGWQQVLHRAQGVRRDRSSHR